MRRGPVAQWRSDEGPGTTRISHDFHCTNGLGAAFRLHIDHALHHGLRQQRRWHEHWRKLTEIETITVRSAQEGMFFDPQNLTAASAAMNYVPTAAERNTRADLIRIAEGYPQGLKIGSFPNAGAKIAAKAYRLENGRRLVAVDEELGLVLMRLDFGPGSLMGDDNRWLHAWEAFKVHGGEIHAAEAFMRGMPANTPSGW
jgi:hypothetical protein